MLAINYYRSSPTWTFNLGLSAWKNLEPAPILIIMLWILLTLAVNIWLSPPISPYVY